MIFDKQIASRLTVHARYMFIVNVLYAVCLFVCCVSSLFSTSVSEVNHRFDDNLFI